MSVIEYTKQFSKGVDIVYIRGIGGIYSDPDIDEKRESWLIIYKINKPLPPGVPEKLKDPHFKNTILFDTKIKKSELTEFLSKYRKESKSKGIPLDIMKLN